jgi:hypothetical protein
MPCARHFGTALVALVCLTACNGAGPGLAPTGPGPTPTPAPTITGEITIMSISPEPGATVPEHACGPGSTRFCADQPQVTFDVVADQDIPNATLTVSFGLCGSARTPVTSLTAGSRMSMSTSRVELSDDGPLHDGVGAALYCDLPAVTTRMIVRLWRSGNSVTPLLTREFEHAYTFAIP